MRWQSFAVGFLGLVGLEVIVSSPTAVARFGGITTGVGNLARKVISPTVPLFGPGAAGSAAPTAPGPSPSSGSASSSSSSPPAAVPGYAANIPPSFAPLPASVSGQLLPGIGGRFAIPIPTTTAPSGFVPSATGALM